jgi:hypothetical protein
MTTKYVFFKNLKKLNKNITKLDISLNNTNKFRIINRHLKLFLNKNNLKYYLYIKFHSHTNTNISTTLKIKNNSSIFLSAHLRQIILNLFRFSENTSQLSATQSLKLMNITANYLFNLTQIAFHFNWEDYLIPMFSPFANQFKFFNKLSYFFNIFLIKPELIFNKHNSVTPVNNLIYNYKTSLFIKNINIFNFSNFYNLNIKSIKPISNNIYWFSQFEYFIFFFSNPIFFKYLFLYTKITNQFNTANFVFSKSYSSILKHTIDYSKNNKYNINNLYYNEHFNYTFNKILIKILDYTKFGVSTIL